jgi:hypothetical protein
VVHAGVFISGTKMIVGLEDDQLSLFENNIAPIATKKQGIILIND